MKNKQHNQICNSYRTLWILLIVFSLLSLAMIGTEIYYSHGEVVSGHPILLWGIPINILLAPAIIYLLVAVFSSILFIKISTNVTKIAKLWCLRLLVLIIFVFGTIFFLGTIINMDSYGIIPAQPENAKCKIIYSWNNSVMGHGSGTFYLATANLRLAHETQYTWSSKNAGPIKKDAWNVEWHDAVGTLNVKPGISINPDDILPAQFICSP